ncbi:MAG: type II secretion system protein N [Colwellia sp.]|nr:type II secretion system protein N [Colwellia sp.]
MKMKFAIAAIFLSVYLAFVIAATPANLVLSYAPLPSGVGLHGVKGTIWQMSIDELVHPQLTISKIEAKLSFWSLFTLNPTISLKFGDTFSDTPSGKLTVSGLFNDVSIQDATINISANYIAQKMPLPIPLNASGEVSLIIEKFVVGKPICQLAQGDVHWPNASVSALNESVNLGLLAAKLSCEQGALAVVIDEKNDLGVSFTAYIRSKGVSGNGYLKPARNFPEKLQAVLPFLGKPDNQGRYRLSF